MKKTITLFLMLFAVSAFGQVYINEFLASNDTTLADGNGDYDDWIELYNAGSSAVDIGGMYISDDPGSLTEWQLPTGDPATLIPAGGFIVLWADKETSQGALHCDIKLSGSGESVLLTDTNGTTVIDSITFGAQASDVSYGRTTDGASTWMTFTPPTPGATNASTAGYQDLNLTSFKVYPNPSTGAVNLSFDQGFIGTVRVYDLLGKVILENKVEGVSATAFEIQKKGVFIVELNSEGMIRSERIIIQ